MKNNLLQVIILFLILTFFIPPDVCAETKDYEKLKKEYDALLADRDNLLKQISEAKDYEKLKKEYDILLADRDNLLKQISEVKDYEKLKKEYDALLIDRDNLFAQSKILLQYKEQSLGLEKAIEQLKAQNEQLALEVQGRVSQIQILKEKIQASEEAEALSIEEKDNLKNSLEKLKIEYKILPETRRKIDKLRTENAKLLRDFKQLENKNRDLEEARLNEVVPRA